MSDTHDLIIPPQAAWARYPTRSADNPQTNVLKGDVKIMPKRIYKRRMASVFFDDVGEFVSVLGSVDVANYKYVSSMFDDAGEIEIWETSEPGEDTRGGNHKQMF
jgi:hypothetical protein